MCMSKIFVLLREIMKCVCDVMREGIDKLLFEKKR